jgi:ADP-ribosylglycohydrolase
MTNISGSTSFHSTYVPNENGLPIHRDRNINGVKGAIAGDVIGSMYEWHPVKTEDFPLFGRRSHFTDDSVLTVATADALLTDGDFTRAYRAWGLAWPDAGYGGRFSMWMRRPEAHPYGSYGNGSAMRSSPAAYAADSIEDVLRIAETTAAVTHNHPQGIIGAQALAGSVFIAMQAASNGDEAACKKEVRNFLEERCGYDMSRTVADIRPGYSFDVTCQGSVPEALICFLEATNFESAVRKAISLGGDSDTQACIAGAVAGALWGVPQSIWAQVRALLDESMIRILSAFQERFRKNIPAARGSC